MSQNEAIAGDDDERDEMGVTQAESVPDLAGQCLQQLEQNVDLRTREVKLAGK